MPRDWVNPEDFQYHEIFQLDPNDDEFYDSGTVKIWVEGPTDTKFWK